MKLFCEVVDAHLICFRQSFFDLEDGVKKDPAAFAVNASYQAGYPDRSIYSLMFLIRFSLIFLNCSSAHPLIGLSLWVMGVVLDNDVIFQ